MSEQLYNNLLRLTKENEAFYYMDYGPYRVFNYRLASYTDFLAPDALEARGIMFYMYGDNKDIPHLVCRPFKKFFNKDENPMTMNLDWSWKNIKKIAIKEDGSIISSYIDIPTEELRLKSKQSLVSEQTKMANEFLRSPENQAFREEVETITKAGNTVIFELVSPVNRIVLEYKKTELRVLGIRENSTGRLLDFFDKGFNLMYPKIAENWCLEHIPHDMSVTDPGVIAELEGIEGYVYTFHNGLMVKVKTNWYKTLHHLKDSVNATRHLFEAVIEERIDDVKAMFSTDEFTMNRIKTMEDLVIPKFNHMVRTVEDFYGQFKELSRKDYAVKGQKELGGFFSLAMEKYIGRDPDYKHFAKKYREEHFGVKASEDIGME